MTKKVEQHWAVGLFIQEVRAMTDAEKEWEGWDDDNRGCRTVLVLSDGSTIYPSRDDEGNGPGTMFGQHNGEGVYV